jgi:hypothetical protein
MCTRNLVVVAEGIAATLYMTQRGNVGDFAFMRPCIVINFFLITNQTH